MRKRKEVEVINLESQDQITPQREEHYQIQLAMTRERYPSNVKLLQELHDRMNKEGHLHMWLYKQKYFCRINRNRFGDWCGYVGVPFGHPVHELNYDEVEEKYDISVHGGLTFSEKVHNWAKDNIWFLGFDCGHACDLNMINIGFGFAKYSDTTYKDKKYVIDETNKLARQLEEIEKK